MKSTSLLPMKMFNRNRTLLVIVLAAIAQVVVAQNPLSQTTQCEVGIGFVFPSLQSGNELMRSADLRDEGVSYYQNAQGIRKNNGKYPALKGLSFHISFYKPIKKIKGLMLGAAVRNSQTGSQPSEGGYEEGYFFNFITAGFAAKYYPFERNNFFVKGEFGLAAVLTKNRFIDDAGEQSFFHQFGIGTAGSLGAGYSFTPFKNKSKAIDLQVIYQQLSTRVEVNGIGDDQWKFGALHLVTSISL